MNDIENDDKRREYDGVRSSDWAKAGRTSWARRKVSAEFFRWLSELRDSRLAEKSGRLWRMLQDGGLAKADVAVVIGALLYCICPFDISPDFMVASQSEHRVTGGEAGPAGRTSADLPQASYVNQPQAESPITASPTDPASNDTDRRRTSP